MPKDRTLLTKLFSHAKKHHLQLHHWLPFPHNLFNITSLLSPYSKYGLKNISNFSKSLFNLGFSKTTYLSHPNNSSYIIIKPIYLNNPTTHLNGQDILLSRRSRTLNPFNFAIIQSIFIDQHLTPKILILSLWYPTPLSQ